jgi:hypothetical protein
MEEKERKNLEKMREKEAKALAKAHAKTNKTRKAK